MFYFDHIFELIPVFLAIVALVGCSQAYDHVRRKHDKVAMLLIGMSASLLIIAQLTWWSTSVIQGKLESTWFDNQIWTIFNSITMISFIVQTKRTNREAK